MEAFSKSFVYRGVAYRAILEASKLSVIKQRSDGYNENFTRTVNLHPFIDETYYPEIFSALGNQTLEQISPYFNQFELDLSLVDIDFARFLMRNKLPASLAYRIALVSNELDNREEMFQNFRKLRTRFYFDSNTGGSALEFYYKLTIAFGEDAAANIILKKSDSFSELDRVASALLVRKIHKDAGIHISQMSIQGLEALLVISSSSEISSRPVSMAITRILSEDMNWILAGRILDRFERKRPFDDLVDSKEKSAAENFFDKSSHSMMFAALSGGYNDRNSSNTIFSILIAKYGVKILMNSYADIHSDVHVKKPNLAMFIAMADHIQKTGDRHSFVEWIMMMNNYVEIDS